MATFDPNRIGPGTFELVRDSTTGNYTIKEVGFTKISPLNLPDLDTTAATTTATQTQTATDVTGDTVSQQTKMAFNMPDRGGDNQPNTTGNMLQEAKKTSSMLDDTFATSRRLMTDTPNYNSGIDIQSPEIKDPTATVFGRPREGNIDQAAIDRQRQSDLGLEQPTVRTNIKGLSARGTIDRRQGTTQETTDDSRFLPSNITTRSDQGEMVAPGIETTKPLDTTTVSDQDLEADPGTKPRTDIKLKQSALKTVSTSLKTTGDSILSKIKTPMMMVLDAIAGSETATQTHDKGYFNVRNDGRIAGNPATDLYAGMNRVSMFGNLEKAGAKRIATREKTIAKKGYGPGDKFYDDTQNMKKQQDNYRSSKNDSNIASYNRDKAKTQGSITQLNPNEMRNVAETGDAGGNSSGGKSIVCTAMYQTTGLEDWKKAMKIWYIYQKKYLTIQHQEGYHKLFKPFVKGMHKNKIIKAIGAHVAKHRTQHLKHIMFNSKPSLLGKVYNKILEPICYWVGKV
jgi:hypothetical protein